VIAPVPDVTMFISKLAERFDVELSPHVSVLFDELAVKCFGGISFADVGERAELPPRAAQRADSHEPGSPSAKPGSSGLRLVAYRPLFSGAAVERTPELEFQKPDAEIQLSRDDAKTRGIRTGDTVTVSSNGTSLELRARIARDLQDGVVRVAREHAGDLHANVEITP
jgi:anaerobic selenocysteine-containing dehydrogenase